MKISRTRPKAKGRLSDMISYRPNAIVSRELIRKRSGTVTLFAFDRGQGLSEHTAPYDALVVILDGRTRIRISGRAHDRGKGEMILMPANKPHSLEALKKFKMMLVMIK